MLRWHSSITTKSKNSSAHLSRLNYPVTFLKFFTLEKARTERQNHRGNTSVRDLTAGRTFLMLSLTMASRSWERSNWTVSRRRFKILAESAAAGRNLNILRINRRNPWIWHQSIRLIGKRWVSLHYPDRSANRQMISE